MSRYSIVIPLYNAEKTITAALESCIVQTLPPLEVIVVDDGSVDHSREIVKSWIEDYHGPVDIICRSLGTNRGPSAARNAGWEICRGEYLCFLDADDRFLQGKLEAIEALLSKTGELDLLAHAHRLEGDAPAEGSGVLKRIGYRDLLSRNRFATPSVTLRRSISERFDESMRYTEDHDLWLRIAMEHEKIYCFDEVLTMVGRRVNTPGGQSGRLWEMRRGEMKMYRKYCQAYGKMVQLPWWWAFSLAKHGWKLLRG